MTSSGQLFACLATLLLITKTANASVAFCIGLKGPGFLMREVVGFKLWDHQGEEASQYRTIYWARKTRMQNNGWYLDMKFSTPPLGYIDLEHVSFSSDKHGSIGPISFNPICDNGSYVSYYGCENTPDGIGYCQSQGMKHMEFCKEHIDMGSDSVSC